jgi:hypothetical protein
VIRIKINGVLCSIENGIWTSEDSRLQGYLRNEEKEFRRKQSDGPCDPDPDHTSALHALQFFGGCDLDLSQHTPPEHVRGRVY